MKKTSKKVATNGIIESGKREVDMTLVEELIQTHNLGVAMTRNEAAALVGLSAGTLANLDSRGVGPGSLRRKATGKQGQHNRTKVVYLTKDVLVWLLLRQEGFMQDSKADVTKRDVDKPDYAPGDAIPLPPAA